MKTVFWRWSAGLIFGVTASFLGVCEGSAETLKLGGGSMNRGSLFNSQTSLLDGRLAQQYSHSDRLKPNYDKATPVVAKSYNGSYKGRYLAMAKAAAQKHGIPQDMFLRLIQQESGWNQGAVSAKGAVGLSQLMPGTAARLGVDETDAQQNLEGGARYLAMMYSRFGSWRLALAAYNAGPQAVDAAGGVPNFTETVNYVAAILG